MAHFRCLIAALLLIFTTACGAAPEPTKLLVVTQPPSGGASPPTGDTLTALPEAVVIPDPDTISLSILNTPAPGAVAALTDTSGLTSNLKSFDVFIPEYGGELNWQGGSQTSIYHNPPAIPIRQGDVFTFVYLEQISEYHSLDGASVLVLTDGRKLAGLPLSDTQLTGESAIGELSLDIQKVKSVSFNTEQIKHMVDEIYVRRWSDDYILLGKFTLISGEVLDLRHVALVYQYSGCDNNWIPCKSYTSWNITTNDIPIKYGESVAEIDLSQLKTMDVSVSSADTFNSYTATVKLKFVQGDEVNTVLDDSNDFRARAFLGTTDYGYFHLPIEAIQSIEFTPGDPAEVIEHCPDALPSRLYKDARGQVAAALGMPLNVRNGPGFNKPAGRALQPGTPFTVEGGPRCVDRTAWYYIVLDDGFDAWVPEGGQDTYFIEPLEAD